MWRRFALAALLAAGALLTGCASVIHGLSQDVRIDTLDDAGQEIAGAQCRMSNDKGEFSGLSGATVPVRRSTRNLVVVCEAPGLPLAMGQGVSRANIGMAGNAVLGSIAGVAIDVGTGAGFNYPSWMQLRFGEDRLFDRSAQEGDAAVRGEAVGSTAPQAVAPVPPAPPVPAAPPEPPVPAKPQQRPMLAAVPMPRDTGAAAAPALVVPLPPSVAPASQPGGPGAPAAPAAQALAMPPAGEPLQTTTAIINGKPYVVVLMPAQAAPVAPPPAPAPVVPLTDPLRRGDVLEYRHTDGTTGNRSPLLYRLDWVDGDQLGFNAGARIEALDGRVVSASIPGGGLFETAMPPGGWARPDVRPGARWSVDFMSAAGERLRHEMVAVAAGLRMLTIDGQQVQVLEIGYTGWIYEGWGGAGSSPISTPFKATVDYAPEMRRVVRFEAERRRATGPAFREQVELLRIRR